MFSSVRRHVTYANVVVTFALVFAMSGGAYAASKYLITSTKQISPKVLKSLVGNAGKAGPAGPAGPAGTAGATGAQGSAGSQGKEGVQGKQGEPGKPGENGKNGTTGFTETLPSGSTEKGDWTLGVESASVGLMLTSASFDIPLQSAPTPIYVHAGAVTPEHCTGDVKEPGAEPGYLCVFANEEHELISEAELGSPNPKICPAASPPGENKSCGTFATSTAADATGFGLQAIANQNGFAIGTWAATAQ